MKDISFIKAEDICSSLYIQFLDS